jgi:hypothetical protein
MVQNGDQILDDFSEFRSLDLVSTNASHTCSGSTSRHRMITGHALVLTADHRGGAAVVPPRAVRRGRRVCGMATPETTCGSQLGAGQGTCSRRIACGFLNRDWSFWTTADRR